MPSDSAVHHRLQQWKNYWDRSIFAKVTPIRTATLSCQTRKRAFHFYAPGVVPRSHAATLTHLYRPKWYARGPCGYCCATRHCCCWYCIRQYAN